MPFATRLTSFAAPLLLLACAATPATGSSTEALAAAPVILALNVRGGPPEGGTLVLIAGTDLDPTATVTFDGVDVQSSTVVAPSGALLGRLLVVTPPHAEGFVDVAVTNPDGQEAVYAGFHYGPPPQITSVSPATGVRPGTLLTITGANFSDTRGVQVGIGPVASVTVVSRSPGELVVEAPKMNKGTYTLWVANFDGQYAVAATQISVAGGGGGGGGGGKN
jgi:hypothetical protein